MKVSSNQLQKVVSSKRVYVISFHSLDVIKESNKYNCPRINKAKQEIMS